MRNVSRVNNKGTYIITYDLGSKIKLLRSIGIKTPDSNDPFFIEFQKEIESRLKSIMPGVNVIGIKMEDLADDILCEAIGKKKIYKDAIIVSSCTEIALPKKGYVLEINRLIDHHGKIIGLGPRPGYPSLDEQIRNFYEKIKRQPIILMEDGTFSGGTISYILDKLEEYHFQVIALIIGFAFPESLKKIKDKFKGDIIVIEQVNDPIDWVPDHDLFLFTPNCGRIFGVSINGKAYPFYSYDGASYCVPYLVPFAPMSEWTSIPEENVNSLSLFCLQKTLELYRRLEKMNDRELVLRDLMGIVPRISIPISLDKCSFPSLDTRVVNFLGEICHEFN